LTEPGRVTETSDPLGMVILVLPVAAVAVIIALMVAGYH
jgi:hypothetical protein